MWKDFKKWLKRKSLSTLKILEPTINVYALINQEWLNIDENFAVGLTSSKIVAKHFTSGEEKNSIKNSIIEVANATLVTYCILNQLFWQNSNEQPSVSTLSTTTLDDLPSIPTFGPNNANNPAFSPSSNENFNHINPDVLLILISESIPWIKLMLKLLGLPARFKCNDKCKGELFLWRLGEGFEALFKIVAGTINCALSGNYLSNGLYTMSGIFSGLITYFSFNADAATNPKLEKLIFSFTNNSRNEEIKKTFNLTENTLKAEDLEYLVKIIQDNQNIGFKVAVSSGSEAESDEQYKISSKNDLVATLKKWLPKNIDIFSDYESNHFGLPYEINAYADNDNYLKEVVVVSKPIRTI